MKTELAKVKGFIEKYKYFAIVIAVGFLFLTFPSGKTEKKEATQVQTAFDVSDFERQIEKALSECSGVGRCRVVLSLDTGAERVYAREQKERRREDERSQESDAESTPSMASEGSGKQTPVLVKERSPKFRGAMVICDGAENSKVRSDVLEAVMSLTGLGSDRVSIVKMKK